jgi:hypothetical protein
MFFNIHVCIGIFIILYRQIKDLAQEYGLVHFKAWF